MCPNLTIIASDILFLNVKYNTLKAVSVSNNHQTRFVKWVTAEKRARQYERGRLDIYWKRLGEERKRFEEQKKEFEAAEADLAQRISEVKDLIPFAAELKKMGFDFNLGNSWLIMIKTYASKKMNVWQRDSWHLT